jgi:hypothetical protein
MRDNQLDVSDWPGVEDRPAREALLQALADSVRFWTSHGSSLAEGVGPAYADKDEARAVEVLSDALQTDDQQQAFREVLRKCLSGLVHSTLVALDGGSHEARTLDLRTSEEGKSLGVALHEEWPDFDPGGATEGGSS